MNRDAQLLREFAAMTPDGNSQAEQLQLRRVKVMRKTAHLVNDLFQLCGQFLKVGVPHLRMVGDGLARAEHLNLQHRQRLPNIIVKFSRNAGTVRLLGTHHSAAELIARHFRVLQALRGLHKRRYIFCHRGQTARRVGDIVAHKRESYIDPDRFSICSKGTHIG